MDLPLDEGGNQEQNKGQDAQEHIFKIALDKLSDQHQDDRQAQDDVDRDHRAFFLPKLFYGVPRPSGGICFFLPFNLDCAPSLSNSGDRRFSFSLLYHNRPPPRNHRPPPA